MPTIDNDTRRRNADFALIHMAGSRLFGDISDGKGKKPDGPGRAEYVAWLTEHTGAPSATKMSKPARIAFIKKLRSDGLIGERQRGGRGSSAQGGERPTDAQLNMIGGLARDMGWTKGLNDKRLASFVTRTAKVSAIRFLTRAQASAVINGLEAWVAQRRGADTATPHAMP